MTQGTGQKRIQDDAWEDLIISILSVNNFPVEKTYAIADRLRGQGLFDPGQLAQLSLEEFAIRLNSAGYARGDFMTGLFAERLVALGNWIRTKGIHFCTNVLENRDSQEIEKSLRSIKGIGPKVLSTFLLLRDIQS